jgi:hypothetical protein
MKRTKVYARHFMCLTLIASAYICRAQDIDDVVSAYFKEIKSGKYPPVPEQFSALKNTDVLLNSVQPFLKDSATVVRSKAYDLVYLVSSPSKISAVRTLAVDILVRACKDNDFGNASLTVDYLKSFLPQDFTDVAKDSIRNMIKSENPHCQQLIKLAGFLHLIDLTEEIRPYMQPGNSTKLRWAAILTLARMGEPSAVKEMIKRVSKLPVNDDVVYQLFPDLIYTRQREALDYIVNAMKSDEKNCRSADAEAETFAICGYRIMEQLAPIIEGIPITLDPSGDVKTSDYREALGAVRKWFLAHKNYKILTDRF